MGTLMNDIKGGDWDNHLFLSLIPPAILGLFASYFSTELWRYGTEHSMVVRSFGSGDLNFYTEF